MNNFSIKIIDPQIRKYYRTYCIGEIQVADLQETFEMPLKYWSQNDYKQQWKNAIKRIVTHEQSCFVIELELTKTAPRANLWILYKDGDIVHMQNKILFGLRFINMLKKEPFTMETCYNFIRPRRTKTDDGMKISEWNIELEAILQCKVE